MKLYDIYITVKILIKETGWRFCFILIFALMKQGEIFKSTHWANEKTDEANVVKRLSFAPALYCALQKWFSRDDSFAILKNVLGEAAYTELKDILKISRHGSSPRSMDDLAEFNENMYRTGSTRFVCHVVKEKTEERYHYIITRCIFNDFFKEVGMTELIDIFCFTDNKFFPQEFPKFDFDRNGSWDNRLAAGCDRCEFVFNKKKMDTKDNNISG
ncbi:MAG: L-2-amino-thiazoline-4-carboxylic acid hydrolase [bacterium]